MAQTVDTRALQDYQRSLDLVYEHSRELMADAPTWQAALYQSLRACYTEMSSHPECLRLHFITTGQDPEVQRVRSAHRDRLLVLLDEVREDAPSEAQGALLLNMIHRMMRTQIINHEVPPDLDAAEHTFATLLFHYEQQSAA